MNQLGIAENLNLAIADKTKVLGYRSEFYWIFTTNKMLPSSPYKVTASIFFSPDILERIDEKCDQLNIKRAVFVREALECYLKLREQQFEKIEALAA